MSKLEQLIAAIDCLTAAVHENTIALTRLHAPIGIDFEGGMAVNRPPGGEIIGGGRQPRAEVIALRDGNHGSARERDD